MGAGVMSARGANVMLVNVLVISHGVKTNKRVGPTNTIWNIYIYNDGLKQRSPQNGKKTQKPNRNCNQIKNYKTKAKCLYDMAIKDQARLGQAVQNTMGQFAALNKNNKNIATFIKAPEFSSYSL